MERRFKPGGPERGKEKEGVRGLKGGITIEYRGARISAPLEALIRGRLVLETPEGKITAKIERSEEFLKIVKEYQVESERHRKTTEEAVKALKETPGVPPEILEKVKEIFGDVKSHLPEIPEILKKLEEELSKLKEELAQEPEEQRRKLENAIRGLEITIGYLRRLQETAEQIEKETVPSNIIERLKDKSFNQAREIIEEWFNNLKEDVYKGLEQIFPNKEERTRFLHNLEQGLISPVHAVNIIARKFLEILKNSGIRVDEILFEYWIKPLVTGIAWYMVDRVLKDYKEKLLQELENLEQQFNQAGQDDQKLRELLRNLYERIKSKNKLLKGLGIQKDGFDQFLEALLKTKNKELEIKNKELALSKLRYLIISALGIRAPKEIFEKINKKVKEIAEVVYDKLRNFSTQQTETPSGPVTGSRGEAISTIVVNKLLSTLERKLEGNKMSKEELMDILGKLFIILSEEEMNKFGSNLEEFINKLKTLSEEEALRLLNEFLERKTGRRLSDEIVEKICKILFAPK